MQFPPDCASRFRSVRPLGAGGHGAVFAAEQVDLGRPAAVKLLNVDAGTDPDMVRRFVDEARITASLKHPSIVVVYDFGDGAGRPWIAYELIEGRTLREELEDGPLAPARALEAAIQIAAALECAHAAGVLHRDIKPDNVFALKSGGFKVADFGIAKWSREGAVATRTGVVLATPHYVSPEQIEGQPASPASDVYATAAVLYELLTGETPFDGDSIMAILDGHLKSPPPVPSAKTPFLPPELDDAVVRALAKRPEDRPASAAELRTVLEGCRVVIGTAGAQKPRVPRVARSSATAVVSRRIVPPTQAVKPARSVSPLVLAGALVALGAAAALSPRPAPSPPAPSAATPAPSRSEPWVAVRDLAVIATDRAAQVDFSLDRPRAVRVDLHGPHGQVRSQSAEADTWIRQRFEELAPETEYVVDVVAGTTPLLRGCRFHTRTERDARSIQSTIDGLYAARLGFDDGSMSMIEDWPHPKMALALARTADSGTKFVDIRPVPEHATRLRDRPLGQALLRRLPKLEDAVARAFTVEAIATARLSEAAAIATAGLAEPPSALNGGQFYSACADALLIARAPDACATLIAAAERLGGRQWAEPRTTVLMIRADPVAARAAFLRWLKRDEGQYLPHLAVTGLAQLDDADSVAALAEIARGKPTTHGLWARAIEGLGASARPEARAVLVELLARHAQRPPLRLLWAATRLELPEVVPLLTRVLGNPEATTRRRAQAAGCLEYLGAPHGTAALVAALNATFPEERFAVISALVARGAPEGLAAAREALATPDASRSDPLLFALARAKDPEGLQLLRKRLDELVPDYKSHELVTLAFLHLYNQLVPDQARPLLERLANDPRQTFKMRNGAAIELDPRRAAARAALFVVPSACFLRTGIHLRRGDTMQVYIGARWGFVGSTPGLPATSVQLTGQIPARLGLEWRIGPYGGQIEHGSDPLTAPVDAELVWTPFGGEAHQNAGPLVMDESENRPAINGRAVMIIDQPLR